MTVMDRAALLDHYRSAVADLDDAVAGITDADLDRPQPSGGWTARQVIHHLADSEAMAYIRLRRLLAEDMPVIRGYDEPEWARRLHYDRPIEASLAVTAAVRASSLELLESAHAGGVGAHRHAFGLRARTRSSAGSGSTPGTRHEHADQIRRARRGEA